MAGPTRRARAVGGRPHRLDVALSSEELVAVQEAAAGAGMAPRAWLGEVGVRVAREGNGAGSGALSTARELFALRSELMQTRRILRNVGGNLNDVARHANSEDALREDTDRVQALVARVVAQVDATVGRVDLEAARVLGQRVRSASRRGRAAADPDTVAGPDSVRGVRGAVADTATSADTVASSGGHAAPGGQTGCVRS